MSLLNWNRANNNAGDMGFPVNDIYINVGSKTAMSPIYYSAKYADRMSHQNFVPMAIRVDDENAWSQLCKLNDRLIAENGDRISQQGKVNSFLYDGGEGKRYVNVRVYPNHRRKKCVMRRLNEQGEPELVSEEDLRTRHFEGCYNIQLDPAFSGNRVVCFYMRLAYAAFRDRAYIEQEEEMDGTGGQDEEQDRWEAMLM